MFRTACIAAALIVTAATGRAASPTPPLPLTSAATASYCEWVMTFEEGVTDRPAWCDDEPSDS